MKLCKLFKKFIHVLVFCFIFLNYVKAEWKSQAVDDWYDPYNQSIISLSLDSKDNPHILYGAKAGPVDIVKYAYYDGVSWSTQTIVSGEKPGIIRVDSNDIPHIIYDDGNIFYKKWNGSSWDTWETNLDRYLDFKLNKTNTPILIYRYGGSMGFSILHYAEWTGNSWSTQTVVDEGSFNIYYASLEFDSQNYPYIAYEIRKSSTGAYIGYLKYAKWDGITWSTGTIDDTNIYSIYSGVSMDIDENDHIYVTYYESYSKETDTRITMEALGKFKF